MPRQEQVLTVFVASPSDVADERDKLEEVIQELNVTWSRELGIRLELLRWETHAFPGQGEDGQDVINQQIPNDYDIFLGIMWCRYGTQTNRAGSGTVEEFERAKARYDGDPNSVKLMMYFKDEAVPPSQLDLGQYAAINSFRESLGNEGALYWKFESLNQFEQLVRLHLARQVQAWNNQMSAQPASTFREIEVPDQVAVFEDEDEFGLLDYAEVYEQQFDDLIGVTNRISSLIEELGSTMTQRTEEMSALPRDSQGNVNRRDSRRLIGRTALDLEQFSLKLQGELPSYSSYFNKGMSALTHFLVLSADLTSNNESSQTKQEGLDSLVKLRTIMGSTQQSILNLQSVITSLPRMTRELNQAKRKAGGVLEEFLNEMSVGQQLLQEAEVAAREVLD